MANTAISVWEKEKWFQPVDVVIVGAGLMGLWTALELKKQSPRLKVTILERSAIPLGASTRNAGFACFGSPTELLYDAETMGVNTMLAVVDMRYRGIRKIRQVLGDENIGFEACGGFECYETWPRGFEETLMKLNEWLKPVVQTNTAFTNASIQMPAMGLHGFEGMVVNALEGALHSGMLVQSLTEKVLEAGVVIQYGAEVTAWYATGGGCKVVTSRGVFIAGKLVLATNACLKTMAPQLGIKPARGQVLVTQSIPGLTMQGTFHFDEGFYYWRHLGDRILLGGARNYDFAAEETLEIDTTASIQNVLQRFLIRHLPQHFSASNIEKMVAMRWSGLMAMSPTKQPVLASLEPGVWAAMCCNGMGVALTPVYAEEVAQQVLTG